ncbi:uncharacterized protein [Aegilops tauschii subsp. strangulata]|uniref:uncharacterized protein n=1 Tax=Aegilops tauschii subsp. strangulata TaxID=200361 RepID=UPI00098B1CF3
MDDPQQAETAPPEDAPARPLLHSVRGVFLNYIGHWRPRFFARPSARPAGAPDYGDLDFLPDYSRGYNSILDHCNGLLLYGNAWLYCVVNTATRRWERLPRMDANNYVPYLVFDPALSHGYEVLLFRREPDKPKKFDLVEFLSLLDDMSGVEEDAENEDQDEPAVEPLPRQSIDDLHRLTEWPPSQWTLPVFSSATGEWRERSFVREGEAVKTMASMQQPMEWGPRWRYSVYWRGALYVHCRGAFVARLSLLDGKYRVFNTPIDFEESKHACPYLGKSEKGVYFATIHKYNNLLRVWNLGESSGPIDWVLKHTIELDESTLWAAARFYQHEINGPWILEDNNNDDVEEKMVPLKENIECNSDDDNVMSNQGGCEEQYSHIYFLGFHPYKEVIFLRLSFTGVAYHLNSSKVQYLGKLHPKDYCTAYSNGIYESFMYTPCMVGELSETPP